jgi:predicted alpha/beta superfamily hydrolase
LLHAQDLEVSAGRLIRIENFPSRFISPRTVDIWLPNNFSLSKKYDVLYMQDGQNLFNSEQAYNQQEWKVDETLDSLISNSVIQDCIVAGIWNKGNNRYVEYYPQKALDHLSKKQRVKFINENLESNPSADAYLKFIVYELKPYIDKNFPVQNDSLNSIIAGSNLGALISLYAICEYPHVFKAAACISVQQTVEDEYSGKAIIKYFKKHIPDPVSHRIYIDYFNLPSLENSDYFQISLDRLFNKKKYTSQNYLSMDFKEMDSNEYLWSKRLYIPMLFLLGNKERHMGM